MFKSMFEQPAGMLQEVMFRDEIYFDRPSKIVTLQEFTATHVNATPGIVHYLGRPCLDMHGAGAATDGSNYCAGVAGVRFVAGKEMRLKFSFATAHANPAIPAFTAGLTVVTTGLTANMAAGGTPPTDYFLLAKRTTEAGFTLKTAKASGAPEVQVLAMDALAAAKWYDFEVAVRTDPTTAGKGTVDLYCAIDGGVMNRVGERVQIAAMIPDTVNLALAVGLRAGDTGTDKSYCSYIGVQQSLRNY